MNAQRLLLLAAASSLQLLASCSSITVKTHADPRADLAKYRTYALSPTPVKGSRTLSPTSFATLRSSLDSGLAAKGIHAASKPSFLVEYSVATRPETSVVMVPGTAANGGWSGYVGGTPMLSYFTEGSIVLRFVDRATKRVIWRGTATGIVGNRKDHQKSLAEAVRKLLDEYPPKH
jgi:hypothetical protein